MSNTTPIPLEQVPNTSVKETGTNPEESPRINRGQILVICYSNIVERSTFKNSE